MCASNTHYKYVCECNNIAVIGLKIGLIFLFFSMFLGVFGGVEFSCGGLKNYVFAQENNNQNIENQLTNSTNEILDDIDFDGFDDIINGLEDGVNLFDGLSFKEYILSILKGEDKLQIDDFFKIIIECVRESFIDLLAPLLIILVIVLLCGMFNNIRSNKISGVQDVIYLVCFSVVVIIVSVILKDLILLAKSSLVSLQNQINLIFPILLTVMTSLGGVLTVKAYTPIIAFLSGAISNIFMYILFPLFTAGLIFSIVGNLSDNTKLSKLNGCISSLFKWIVGTVFALFTGLMSIKGILAGNSDGMSIKMAKYAIKNYIPMLGGYISEGFELVKAGGLLVKNATGFAGVILLLSTIILPLISIAILQLGLKLLAGIIEVAGDKKSSNLIYDIAKSLRYLVVIIVGISLMYFLVLFLTICSVSNIL